MTTKKEIENGNYENIVRLTGQLSEKFFVSPTADGSGNLVLNFSVKVGNSYIKCKGFGYDPEIENDLKGLTTIAVLGTIINAKNKLGEYEQVVCAYEIKLPLLNTTGKPAIDPTTNKAMFCTYCSAGHIPSSSEDMVDRLVAAKPTTPTKFVEPKKQMSLGGETNDEKISWQSGYQQVNPEQAKQIKQAMEALGDKVESEEEEWDKELSEEEMNKWFK